MVSDDHTALAAISIGALTSGALTLVVGLSLLEPEPVEPADAVEVVDATEVSGAQTSFLLEAGPVVDFAIIRGPEQLMAGPESPMTGWAPVPRPLRLYRSR